MGDLAVKLGIDWKLLIAQIINFGVLVWLLHRFAYKPIIAALHKRSQTIAKSLEEAKQIEIERSGIAAERQRVIDRANREAAELVEQARKNANDFQSRTRAQAQDDAAAIVAAAERDAAATRAAVVADARAELGELVVLGTEKLLRAKLNPTADRKLIDEALQAVKERE